MNLKTQKGWTTGKGTESREKLLLKGKSGKENMRETGQIKKTKKANEVRKFSKAKIKKIAQGWMAGRGGGGCTSQKRVD